MRGKIKKVFPGGNTSQGFYSFYHHILSHNANRIFLFKGGPGTGKSAFMNKIADSVSELNYDVEYHCCSSDNTSIDAIVIPDLKVAFMDGTAPHSVDPQYPGLVEEIIDLGAFLDEVGLQGKKKEIIQAREEVKRLFRLAYAYLQQSKILKGEIESYYTDSKSLDIPGLNETTLSLNKLIFGDKFLKTTSKERHLFASAITPQGAVNHLDTIFSGLDRRIIIEGSAGTGKAAIVKNIYQNAVIRGFDVEIYHCGLIPQEIEHIVIKELNTRIKTSEPPHIFNGDTEDKVIKTHNFVDFSLLNPFMDDLEKAKTRYEEAFGRGVTFINRAKRAHDILENYYKPNMDFEKLDDYFEEILEKILFYSEKKHT